jgi:hypothetical protein
LNSRIGSPTSPASPEDSFFEGTTETFPKPESRGFQQRFSQFNKSTTSWIKPEITANINVNLSSLNQIRTPIDISRRGRNSHSSLNKSLAIDSLLLQSELQKENMIKILKNPTERRS